MRKIPYGEIDFETVVKNNLLYIDKTSYIEKLESDIDLKKTLYLRPGRFGKSLFTSMLNYYYAIDAVAMIGLTKQEVKEAIKEVLPEKTKKQRSVPNWTKCPKQNRPQMDMGKKGVKYEHKIHIYNRRSSLRTRKRNNSSITRKIIKK